MKSLTAQEVDRLRSETKGTSDRVNFNNAGSSFPPDAVVDSVVNYLTEEATLGGYEMEARYREPLEKTYDSIARLINARRDEIAIVESASAGWILAFQGIGFSKGDEVITCEMEYVTNILGLLYAKKNFGIVIKTIPNDNYGNFSLEALEQAITPRTKLMAMTHISSTAGGMIPIEAIGKIARQHNILYLIDACQSAGQIPLDVREINCDMLSVTGRKYLRAPRGTGFLFVRKEVQDRLNILFMDGFTAGKVTEDDYTIRNDARRFEMYEKSRALTLGLGKATDYALAIGVDRIWDRVQYLADHLRDQLKTIEGVVVHDTGDQKCGIVTFSVNGIEPGFIKEKLFDKKINVSVALARSALYYMNKNNLAGIVRASLHYYNTVSESIMMCDAIRELKDIPS